MVRSTQYQVTTIVSFRPRLGQTLKAQSGGSIRMYYPKTLLCQGFLAECKAKGFTSFNSCGRNHLLNCPRTRHRKGRSSLLDLNRIRDQMSPEEAVLLTAPTLQYLYRLTNIINSSVPPNLRCHQHHGQAVHGTIVTKPCVATRLPVTFLTRTIKSKEPHTTPVG